MSRDWGLLNASALKRKSAQEILINKNFDLICRAPKPANAHTDETLCTSDKRPHIFPHYIFRHALALHFVYGTWGSERTIAKTTPAIAAGLTDKQMTVKDIVALIDARASKPGRPKNYKKKPDRTKGKDRN